MNESQKRQFATLMTNVFAYYNKDCSDFTIQLFWNACEGFEFEQIQKAIQAHCLDAERGVFPPKVADIVRVMSGTVTDRAALAWGKVLEAMSRVGAYTDVVFDDPAIHAAIEDCGGWVKICRSQTEEISYLQHRFCQSHKAYTGRGEFEYQRRLIGDRSPDHDYAKRGIPLPKPAIVGDIEKARIVYRGGNVGGKTAIGFHDLQAIAVAETLKMLEAS